MSRLHAVPARDPAIAPHLFAGPGRTCERCGQPPVAHAVGERPLALAGLRCTRCVRRGESMWCRCSRARTVADLRDLLQEARVLRRDPLGTYSASDVAIRVAGAGAIRRTLAVADPGVYLT